MRTIKMIFFLCLLATLSLFSTNLRAEPIKENEGQERPNILWIVSEDNSPYLGCYGDPLAQTPNIDKLASQGILFDNAFANAPVCSAARSTLITGMYVTRTGTYHHRSAHLYPEKFKPYPLYFREAGYFCVNNGKKDYNLKNDQNCWDEYCSSWGSINPDAHYNHREPGQPFFAIFNLGESHEEYTFPKEIKKLRESGKYAQKARVDPMDIPLPPYHPDLPVIREE